MPLPLKIRIIFLLTLDFAGTKKMSKGIWNQNHKWFSTCGAQWQVFIKMCTFGKNWVLKKKSPKLSPQWQPGNIDPVPPISSILRSFLKTQLPIIHQRIRTNLQLTHRLNTSPQITHYPEAKHNQHCPTSLPFQKSHYTVPSIVHTLYTPHSIISHPPRYLWIVLSLQILSISS